MASITHGADPQLLEALATQLTNMSEKVDNLADHVAARVTSIEWHGRDREELATAARTLESTEFRRVGTALKALATTARRNAQHQRATSRDDGGPTSDRATNGGASTSGPRRDEPKPKPKPKPQPKQQPKPKHEPTSTAPRAPRQQPAHSEPRAGVRAVKIATKELGIDEVRNPRRVQDFLAAAGFPGASPANTPWCAAFVTWALKQAGKKHFPARPAWVFDWRDDASAGRNGLSVVKPGQVRPGDIVVFNHGDGHIGFVTSTVASNGTYQTLEGNSSNRVQRVQRGPADVPFFIRVS